MHGVNRLYSLGAINGIDAFSLSQKMPYVVRQHIQACPLTKTANAAIQPDVVQIGRSRLHIPLVLLAPVAQLEDLLLPVLGVVIEVHLAVHAEH